MTNNITNALFETNLDNSIDSGNFSVRGYLPLIWNNSITHVHGLAVYMKEGLLFARDSKKLCGFVLMFSTGFTSLIVLLIFPLSITFVFMHGLRFLSSNVDEVLSIKPSAIVFVFGDFNIHQKHWLRNW